MNTQSACLAPQIAIALSHSCYGPVRALQGKPTSKLHKSPVLALTLEPATYASLIGCVMNLVRLMPNRRSRNASRNAALECLHRLTYGPEFFGSLRDQSVEARNAKSQATPYLSSARAWGRSLKHLNLFC
jgi:hypothetical protein